LQAIELLLVVHTTNQRADLETGVATEILGIRRNLHDQFAGRRNYQGAGLPDETLRLDGVVEQVIENRDQESRCLAGTSLGLADSIVPLQGVRKDLCLDRRTVAKVLLRDAMHHAVHQAQVVKAGLPLLRWHLEIVHAPGRLSIRALRWVFPLGVLAAVGCAPVRRSFVVVFH